CGAWNIEHDEETGKTIVKINKVQTEKLI
ncbi:MAG: hypothetical protein PWQ59_1378, partial [Thermoanaerobacterium sp.]|nr:hypothetical protein [Thermoanaerobacterium sp.]